MILLIAVVTVCIGMVVVTAADDAIADQVAAVVARWPRCTAVMAFGWSLALAIHLLTEATPS